PTHRRIAGATPVNTNEPAYIADEFRERTVPRARSLRDDTIAVIPVIPAAKAPDQTRCDAMVPADPSQGAWVIRMTPATARAPEAIPTALAPIRSTTRPPIQLPAALIAPASIRTVEIAPTSRSWKSRYSTPTFANTPSIEPNQSTVATRIATTRRLRRRSSWEWLADCTGIRGSRVQSRTTAPAEVRASTMNA